MNPKKNVTLQVEQLEERLVPASAKLSQGVLKIVGDNTSERIRVFQTNGILRIADTSLAYNASQVKLVEVHGNGGNDTIDLRGIQVNANIYGGSGNDTLIGGEKGDLIDGGDHYDLIFGMGGGDVLRGGNHDDRIFGGAGYDYIYGGYGSDFMDDGMGSRESIAVENDGAPDYVADMLTPASGYSADHVNQNQSGTCAFLAVIAGMARSGVNMGAYITYQGYDDAGNGIYDVKLHNGRQWQTFRVHFNGQVHSADNEKTAEFASWSIIMHRAWMQYHGTGAASADKALRALGRAPSGTNTFTSNYFNSMSSALASGKVVTAVTHTSRSNVISTLEENHYYTVVGTFTYGGVRYVRLRNPWGSDGNVASDSNPADGYVTITFSQFVNNMKYAAIG